MNRSGASTSRLLIPSEPIDSRRRGVIRLTGAEAIHRRRQNVWRPRELRPGVNVIGLAAKRRLSARYLILPDASIKREKEKPKNFSQIE